MISMSYSCTKCEFRSALLEDAQEHANSTRHHLDIKGFISPNGLPKSVDARIELQARERAKQSAILRLAKERGLVR